MYYTIYNYYYVIYHGIINPKFCIILYTYNDLSVYSKKFTS